MVKCSRIHAAVENHITKSMGTSNMKFRGVTRSEEERGDRHLSKGTRDACPGTLEGGHSHEASPGGDSTGPRRRPGLSSACAKYEVNVTRSYRP